jgi:hypothetical protein
MENRLDFELCKDIVSFGIRPTERVLHLGCGDKQTNFLDNLQILNPAVFYLGIDIDFDVIENMRKKYSEFPTYSFDNTTIQNFLDFTMHGREDIPEFENTVITGIFDKPLYKEKQYIFISMVVKRCLQFSNQVIFTVDDYNYRDYNYSVLYVINNLISSFDNVKMIKKLNKYIFCITY